MAEKINRLVIDVSTFVIHKVWKTWEDKQVASALLIDVKGAFDHVLQVKLAQKWSIWILAIIL